MEKEGKKEKEKRNIEVSKNFNFGNLKSGEVLSKMCLSSISNLYHNLDS